MAHVAVTLTSGLLLAFDGCYWLDPTSLPGDQKVSTAKAESPAECAESCRGRGLLGRLAVNAHGQCYCLGDLVILYDPLDGEECSAFCPGYSYLSCGGWEEDTFHVYTLSAPADAVSHDPESDIPDAAAVQSELAPILDPLSAAVAVRREIDSGLHRLRQLEHREERTRSELEDIKRSAMLSLAYSNVCFASTDSGLSLAGVDADLLKNIDGEVRLEREYKIRLDNMALERQLLQQEIEEKRNELELDHGDLKAKLEEISMCEQIRNPTTTTSTTTYRPMAPPYPTTTTYRPKTTLIPPWGSD